MIPLILAPLLAKLAESGLSLIGNAVLNKGKQVVEDKLGVSLDSMVETEQGKQALLQLQTDHEEFLITAALDNRKLDLEFYKEDAADRAGARSMNTDINNSEHSSWLSKNIAAILAVIVVVGGGFMIAFAPEADVRLGATSIVTLVLGYYFGTTSSSHRKDTTIQSLAQGAAK